MKGLVRKVNKFGLYPEVGGSHQKGFNHGDKVLGLVCYTDHWGDGEGGDEIPIISCLYSDTFAI